MLSRFFSLLVLACVLCFSSQSSQAQEDVSPKHDNFYEELRRNFVPAPTRKPVSQRQVRSGAFDDLTENNAAQWSSFASDGALTKLSNETSKVKVGAASLLFTTKSGGDTGVRYPASGEAHLDVTSKNRFVFWAYGYNTNSYGFRKNQPIVVINCKGGSISYEPSEQQMSNDYWRFYAIPLAGSPSWIRTVTGNPDLADVLSLEIRHATWGDSFSVCYDGVAFKGVPTKTGTIGTPPPGVNPDAVSPRILLYCFDPIMENMGGVRQHQAFGWNDPLMLAEQSVADFKRSSHGLYQPQIVETVMADEHPYFVDGFQHTDESFTKAWNVDSRDRDFHLNSVFDYARFCREHNLVARVESGDIDEVWLYTAPIGGLWESTMIGDGAYWLNSPPPGVHSKRLFAIMSAGFERGVAETLHGFGHRCESLLVHNYGGWRNDQSTTWNKFTLRDQLAPGLGGVGNVHFPVNATADYDYANPTAVPSNADDWANFPNFQNVKRTFSSAEWSPQLVDPHREYMNWWYSHMPHGSGVGPDGFLNNWWRYIADFDQFKAWDGNLFSTEGIPTVRISTPSNGSAVSGTVNITAEASVDGALGRVDFYVDGVYKATDTLAPYKFAWDTTGLSGIHRLEARAVELSVGNEAVSAPILVNVGETPVPVLSVSDATLVEGNEGTTQMSFTVTRTGDTNIAASVSYATADGTATEGSDYISTSGTLTFEPGQTEHTVVVTIAGDSEAEDDETLFLKLSSLTSALLGNGNGVGTIRNDDTSVSVNDVSVAESDPTAQATFTVTLSHAVPYPVDVNYTTGTDDSLSDSATVGVDFTPISGVLHFEPNQTSATVSVPVVNDSDFEHDEQFFLDVSGVTATKPRGIGTIRNDDAKPLLSVVGPGMVLEGNSGTREVKFTLSLSKPSKISASVAYTTSPGANNPGTDSDDFTPVSGTLTFAPGEVEKTITVAVKGDTEVEADETFSLQLSLPIDVSLSNTALQTLFAIQNDDTKVTINDITLFEDTKASAGFSVTLSPPVPVPVDVTFVTGRSTQENAATPDVDFTATSKVVHFQPGLGQLTVGVHILDDFTFEADEVFPVNISVLAGSGAIVEKAQGVATIRDNDSPPTVSAKIPTFITEGSSGKRDAIITLSLSAPSGLPASFDYRVAPNGNEPLQYNSPTPDKDYVPVSGTLTFAPGQTVKQIAVPIIGDTEIENDEPLALRVSSPKNILMPPGFDTFTIRNDDTTVSVSDVSTAEGNGTAKAPFTVTLTPPVPVAVDVAYTTSSITEANAATPGEDYTSVSGILHIAPNQKSAIVAIPVIGDTNIERDERFYLSISTAPGTGVTVSRARGVATLRNDDAGPNVSIETPQPLIEGNSGVTPIVFKVNLSKASGLPASVAYSLVPGKVNPATAGQDYVATSGTLLFSPGQTSKTITVYVRGDIIDEANESFSLTLANPVGLTLTTSSATAIITDDDTGQVTVGAATVIEGNAGRTFLRFPVSMSLLNSRPVVVTYATGNVATASLRATPGSDYVAMLGTLTLVPNQTRTTIDVPVLGDTLDEQDERVALVLKQVQGAALGGNAAEGVIRDDDAPVRVSIFDISINEGNRASYATFLVSLSAVSGHPVSVSYTTAAGTATQGSDFTTTSGTLSFAPGETQKRISVPIVGDLVRENNEAFLVKLTNLQNAQFARAQATCTILNDDK